MRVKSANEAFTVQNYDWLNSNEQSTTNIDFGNVNKTAKEQLPDRV